ncbi:MAG: hemolysin family protein [Luteibaculaceae bacterium]
MSSYTIVIICLLLSAFFSGVEIAYLSINRLKIEVDTKQGSFSAAIISKFLRIPSKFIGTILVGNNIALVIYGIVMGKLINNLIFSPEIIISNPFLVIMVQTIISTLIVLFVAEFLPKAIFRISPNNILKICAIPIWLIYYALWVFTLFTIGLAEYLLKVFFKFDNFKDNFIVTKIELDNFVRDIKEKATNKSELDHEIQIFHNALDFKTVKARECMVPRNEIEAISITDTIEEAVKRFVNTGYSKLLIYKENIDDIVGYVHCNEIFKQPKSINEIMLPVAGFFPETATADKLMEQLINKKKGVAVIVDEFGGTAGIITLEDVVEVIFGDIEDEHDYDEHIEEVISDNQFRFAGRLEIDYINEKFDLDLPDSEDYETLAGLILYLHESIPEKGITIENDNFIFTIEKVSGNKIEIINVQKKD